MSALIALLLANPQLITVGIRWLARAPIVSAYLLSISNEKDDKNKSRILREYLDFIKAESEEDLKLLSGKI